VEEGEEEGEGGGSSGPVRSKDDFIPQSKVAICSEAPVSGFSLHSQEISSHREDHLPDCCPISFYEHVCARYAGKL
jgi:hypothetical protein